MASLAKCALRYVILKTEEHRKKEYIEKQNVCSSKFDIRLSFQCFAPADAYSTALLLMIRTNAQYFAVGFHTVIPGQDLESYDV